MLSTLRAPLVVWASLGCLTGIWCAEMGGAYAVAATGAALLAGRITLSRLLHVQTLQVRTPRPPDVAPYLELSKSASDTLLVFLVLGALMWSWMGHLARQDTLSAAIAAGKTRYVAFEGTVRGDPRVKMASAASESVHPPDGDQEAPRSMGFSLQVKRLEGAGGRLRPVNGRLYVRVANAPGAAVIRNGEEWRFIGRLQSRTEVAEPGFEAWLRHGRISGIARVPSIDDGRRLARASGAAVSAVATVRGHAAAAARRYLPEKEAALLMGVSLGDGSLLDEATVDEFRRTGLSHLVVASGMNVAIVAGVILVLLSRLPLPRYAKAIAAAAAVGFYVLLAGAGPPVARAGLMACIALAVWSIGRSTTTMGLLAASALGLLILDPYIAFDISFQLSFCATLGLILLVDPVKTSLRRVHIRWLKLDRKARRDASAPESRPTPDAAPSRLSAVLLETVAVTIAAQLAVLPVILHHFGTLSPYSLLANTATTPVASVALILGLIAPVGSALGWIPGLLLYAPLHACLAWMLAVSSRVAQLPGSGAAVEPISITWSIAMVAGLFILRWLIVAQPGVLSLLLRRLRALGERLVLHRSADQRRNRPRGSPRAVIPMAVALCVILALGFGVSGRSKQTAAQPAGMMVHFLDVGQGDASLIRAPSGESVLIDTGPPDSGVERELKRLGVRGLRAVVITHFHSDHSGSLIRILRTMPVDEVIVSAASEPGRELSEATKAAAAAEIPLHSVATRSLMKMGDVTLRLETPRIAGGPANPNDASIVARAEYGQTSFLFTGDVEIMGQGALLDAANARAEPDTYDSDVLKVAHHGSRDSVDTRFLEAVSPTSAVISVGCGNSYHHPTPEALAALKRSGATVYRTDRDRAVILFSDGGQVFEYAKGRSRTCR